MIFLQPYNFERLLFYLTEQNHDLVQQWMSTMESTAKVDLDKTWHQKLQDDFSSARITDDEMCTSMKKVHDELDYCIDPHTAVAVAAAGKLGYDLYDHGGGSETCTNRPYAILSTASPCKFEESVTIGLGSKNWESYFESSEFPKRARMILDKEEVKPFEYKWIGGQTLEEVQVEWEKQARKLVDDFSSR